MAQLSQLECHLDTRDAEALRAALTAVFGPSEAIDELLDEAFLPRRIQDGVAAGAPWPVPGADRRLRFRPVVYRWDDGAGAPTQLDLVIDSYTLLLDGTYRAWVGPAIWTLARGLAAVDGVVLAAFTDEASEGAPWEWRSGNLDSAWEFDLLCVASDAAAWVGEPPDAVATQHTAEVCTWVRRAPWRLLPWLANF